jgi:hypothetical protein
MAFVDQLAIAADQIGDLALSYQALNDGDIYSTSRACAASIKSIGSRKGWTSWP